MATIPVVPAKPERPNWLSIKEAAEYLDVGEPTLYRWMREGKITFRKVGDSTRFLQADLDAVVQVYPSEKDAKQAQQFCPVCHHDELIPGDVRSTGLVYFHPKKSRFWVLKESMVPVNASMCTRCGFVLLNGDVAKLSALKAKATPAAQAKADAAEAP